MRSFMVISMKNRLKKLTLSVLAVSVSAAASAEQVAFTKNTVDDRTVIVNYKNSGDAVTVHSIDPGCSCLSISTATPFDIPTRGSGSITIAYDGSWFESEVHKIVRVTLGPSQEIQPKQTIDISVCFAQEVPCELSPDAIIWSIPGLSDTSQESILHRKVLVVPMDGFTILDAILDEPLADILDFKAKMVGSAMIIRASPKPGSQKPVIGKCRISFRKDGRHYQRDITVALVE
jgi:hypothetical protein